MILRGATYTLVAVDSRASNFFCGSWSVLPPSHASHARLAHFSRTAPVAEPADEVHIDVDTFDESDNHSLHEVIGQMWENVSSTNSSPADSSYQSNNGEGANVFSQADRKKKKRGTSTRRACMRAWAQGKC